MKTPSSQYFLAFGLFAVSAVVVIWALGGSGTYLKSTPYQTRNAAADSDLSRLTGGAGAGILDGVVARVKAKAESKGGNPMNAAAYNAYLDSYLSLVDKLDDTTRAQVGPEYAFLFKYIYPRVYELRKPDSAAQATALVAEIGNLVTAAENGTVTQTQTQVAPSAPVITSPANLSQNAQYVYQMTWAKVSGVDYHTAIDNGTGSKLGSGTGWAIPFSGFVPGSTHTAKVKACRPGTGESRECRSNPATCTTDTDSCSGWSTVAIQVTAATATATATVATVATATGTALVPGQTLDIVVQVGVNGVDKPVTLNCSSYQESVANVPPDGIYIRCKADIKNLPVSAVSTVKNSFGNGIKYPASASAWWRNLNFTWAYYGTSNDDQLAFSDAACTKSKDYFMGSGRYVKDGGVVTAIPAEKLGETSSVANTKGQTVADTKCNYFWEVNGYGKIWYKNKAAGWTMVELTYENIVRPK